MKSSFLLKNEGNIVRISALNVRAKILAIFCSFFGRNDDFINLFWDLLTFTQGRNPDKICSYFGNFINSFWNCLTFKYPEKNTFCTNIMRTLLLDFYFFASERIKLRPFNFLPANWCTTSRQKFRSVFSEPILVVIGWIISVLLTCAVRKLNVLDFM